MNKTIKSVGIMAKNDDAIITLHDLITALKGHGVNVILEKQTANLIGKHTHRVVPHSELNGQCELVIVVGGDGSMLHAAHTIVNQNLPIIGINRGNLGFLTDIRPDDIQTALLKILDGQYTEEKRFLLNAAISFDNKWIDSQYALNEAALLPGPKPHLIDFEIYVDDQFMCRERADGLIIATPTGSTAYALSGGGPILHPELDAIVLVPMFPHSLHSRPIVVAGDHDINLIISKHNDTMPRLCCDGREYIDIQPGSLISISKKSEHLRLLHPHDYDYYGALRSKLHWGNKNIRSD